MDAQAACAEKVVAEADEKTRQAEPLEDSRYQVTSCLKQPCLGEPLQDRSSVFPKPCEGSAAAIVPQPRSDLRWTRAESSMASPQITLNDTPWNWEPLCEAQDLSVESCGSDETLIEDPYFNPTMFASYNYFYSPYLFPLNGSGHPGYKTEPSEERGENLSMNRDFEAIPLALNAHGVNLTPNDASQLNPNTSRDESSQTETESSPTPGRDSSKLTQSPLAHQHSDDELANHQTETSTPNSSSFWLAESPDDEIERLGEDHPFMRFKTVAVTEVIKRFTLWTRHLVEQDTPYQGTGQPSIQYSQDKGKEQGSAKRKRSCADHLETSQGNTDDSEPSSSQATSSKRRRTLDQKSTFACPYAKKDPMSYKDCYRYTLSRIRDVKQHLARCHRNPPYCPRCRGTFQTEEERDEHIREVSCPLRPSIKFEGVTESQRQQLAKKSASNTPLEAQWFAVFDILFPGHEPRPQSPYIDNELLQDITLYQGFLTSNGPRILSDVLTRRGAVTWNLPNEERDLAAFQQTVFEEGLREIFGQWVARRIGSSELEVPNILSGSGIASNPTPPSSSTSVERAGSDTNQAPGVLSPGITSALPGGGPTTTFASSGLFEDAVSGQNDINESLDDIFNFGQEGLEFHVGPDDELMRLMVGIHPGQPNPSFPPAPG